jgi:hypothetical protein
MLTRLLKGVKKCKDFQIEDIFDLAPVVSTAPVVHLKLRISPRMFEKNRTGPNGIL